MLTAVLLMLAATPVTLSVDLSKSTTARLGPRVRELVEQRLQEEGFAVEPGAKLELRVEELHGKLLLSAQAGEHISTSELRPAEEWPAELGFELAQRLAVLAHEAEAYVPKPQAHVVVEEAPAPLPIEPQEEPAPPPPDRGMRVSAGFRLGVVVRAPAVDPMLSFHGALPIGVVEPMISMGLVVAPGPGLLAWEVPFLGGLRVPIALPSSWSLVPELLGGGRLHFFGATSLDPAGGVRVDPMGALGVAVLRQVGQLKLGLRLGIELSTPREHLEGNAVIWSRGAFAFSAMIQVER